MSNGSCGGLSSVGPAAVLAALAVGGMAAASEGRVAASVAREARGLARGQNSLYGQHAVQARGNVLQGVRNRLFLKYFGVDYEFWNTDDMRYRPEQMSIVEGSAA